MITVNKGQLDVDGETSTILAELSYAVGEITKRMSDETGVSQNEYIETMIKAVRFNNLKLAGMTSEEAFEIMTGQKADDVFKDLEEETDVKTTQ